MNIKRQIFSLFLLTFMLLPFFSFAAVVGTPTQNDPTGVVDTTGGGKGTGLTYECSRVVGGITIYGDCGYDDLIRAIKKFFGVAIPLALGFSVVVIAYAGYNYMISGSSPGKRTEANNMLQKVVIGIFFMLSAWVIVTLITNSLLKTDVNTLVPLK